MPSSRRHLPGPGAYSDCAPDGARPVYMDTGRDHGPGNLAGAGRFYAWHRDRDGLARVVRRIPGTPRHA